MNINQNETQTTPAERCQIVVVEFMRDWNSLPPEACAWRMFSRLKTALAHMEYQHAPE